MLVFNVREGLESCLATGVYYAPIWRRGRPQRQADFIAIYCGGFIKYVGKTAAMSLRYSMAEQSQRDHIDRWLKAEAETFGFRNKNEYFFYLIEPTASGWLCETRCGPRREKMKRPFVYLDNIPRCESAAALAQLIRDKTYGGRNEPIE